MGLALAKRLLLCLTVVAFVGAPWAQAFAQTLAHGCDAPAQAAAGHAVHAAYKPARSEVTSNKANAGKVMIGSCIRTCSAPLNVMLPANPIALPDWPQTERPAMNTYLHGRAVEPELAPPIDLV